MYDITLQQLLLRVAALLAIASVHGLAMALTARLLGDDGPRHDGRLTANPIMQADLAGALCAILFNLGWNRPMAIDPARLRLGRLGLVLVVAAGFLSMMALIAVVSMIRVPAFTTLPDSAALTVDAWAKITAQLAAAFALFNLLPMPPLSGAHLLAAINPAWRVPEKYHTGWAVGLAVVIIVLWVIGYPADLWFRPWYAMISAPFLD
jgi:Zn-dependent protease